MCFGISLCQHHEKRSRLSIGYPINNQSWNSASRVKPEKISGTLFAGFKVKPMCFEIHAQFNEHPVHCEACRTGGIEEKIVHGHLSSAPI
jgi:hypothetical protein